MNKWLKYFLATGITVMVILSVLEIASRVALTIIYNRDFDSSLIIDNKYFTSSGLKENANGTVWGKQFHTDEFGGRKNAVHDKKKKKWVFIGDSVTEGVGVEDSATFSSLCSKEFTDFNLLNISLIGYSSSDYLNVLRSILANDTSVELVTLFFCLNDVYGNSNNNGLPAMSKQSLLGKANSFLQERYATYKLIKIFFYQNSNNYFKYDSQFYEKDNSHFKESMNHLLQCDSLCKAKSIFFQVAMLPYKSQLTEYGKANFPQELVRKFCDKDSIGVSDAALFLSKQSNVNSFYLFADEIHFSVKGHRAMAEFLLQ